MISFLFLIYLHNFIWHNSIECKNNMTCESFHEKNYVCVNRTTNRGNICCSVKSIDDHVIRCLSIPISHLIGHNYYFYNKKIYFLDCNKTYVNDTTLKKCGKGQEQSSGDCQIYSSFVNSCCFRTGPKSYNNSQGCYWLGSKFSGDIFWAGMNLTCDYLFLKMPLKLIIIIISLNILI